MLTKTTIAVATAFVIGIAAAAIAAPETDQRGGYRESGAGAFATQGINPIYHKDSAAKCVKAYPKTYDPATMTFVGRDGVRRPCP
jgi:BA14K-like protein